MYKRIEESYKNKSIVLKFNRDILFGLIIIIFISFPCSFSGYWVYIAVIVGVLFVYCYIRRQLGYKFRWKNRKEWFDVTNVISSFKKKIIKEENELILDILKKEKVD